MNVALPQNVDAREECGKVESHDEPHCGKSVEILAVGKDYPWAGDNHVGDEEDWVTPVVVRDPAVDEATFYAHFKTRTWGEEYTG